MNPIRKKIKKGYLSLLLIIGIFTCLVSISNAATYYMPDNFPDLQTAFANMVGCDTLIIRDGIYTGTQNAISNSQRPPNGTSDNHTKIYAENPGQVIFDGEHTREMFCIATSGSLFLTFEGLIWMRTRNSNVCLRYTSDIKFIRCGAHESSGASPNFSFRECSYILAEECYAWGSGRYKFSSYQSEKIVYRRCVGRMDACDTRHPGSEPIGIFAFYWTSDAEAQNCVAIDSDHPEYWVYSGAEGAFTCPNNSAPGHNVYFRGCVALNVDLNFNSVGTKRYDVHYIDCSGWDLNKSGMTRGSADFTHCTFGSYTDSTTPYGMIHSYEGTCNALNNIVYGSPTSGGKFVETSDYNCFCNNNTNYSDTTKGSHDICSENNNAIDPIDGNPGNGIPSLKYLCRIEDNSNLDGAASDGGDIGATIIKRIGKSGTLWGEPGYNLLQDGTNGQADKNLWPFPNEDIIREHMRSYSYDNGKLRGDRGFCADGQTLTKYIWEYLGNPIPPEIYDGVIVAVDGGQGLNKDPVADAGEDQYLTDADDNGQEQVTLKSESYDPDGTISSYVWSENGTEIAVGVNPTITLDVDTHLISLAVTDNDNATKTDEVFIEIVAAAGDQASPVISNVQSGNSTSTSATISWDTNEPSTSAVLYGLTSSYGHRVENVDLVLNHEVVLSGLEPSTTYHFQVISKNSNDNEASSSDFTCSTENQGTTSDSLQDFEDGVLWQPGGSQDPTGNGRGWAFLSPMAGDKIEIDNIGANGSSHSLKLTFASSNDTLYFRSNDKITDRMPEAAGANRMSFYVRFPEGFPIQPLPFRYDTWQLGTFIHNPDDWSDTHRATSEPDNGIHHYYHRVTMEQVGDGWIKYIFNTHPDQANYSGSTVPSNIPYYYDNFGRFYLQFGKVAGGPEPPRPFTIWIDEIKFYYDDGTIGGHVHDGGQDDAGFDGQFIPDSDSGSHISAPTGLRVVEEIK